MTVETCRSVLLWAGLMNYGFLILWVGLQVFARGWIHRRAAWYGLKPEQSDTIQFAGIVFYKVCIWMFFLIPYVALRIAG